MTPRKRRPDLVPLISIRAVGLVVGRATSARLAHGQWLRERIPAAGGTLGGDYAAQRLCVSTGRAGGLVLPARNLSGSVGL